MKKSNAALIFCCITLLIFIICLFNIPLDELLSSDYIFDTILWILLIIVVVIPTFLYNASQKIIKMNGEKKKGYIITINDHCNSGEIDIYVDGKVYSFGGMEKNDVYVKLFETFQDRYSLYGDGLLLKGIPIDVYVYGDKVSPVLESVKLEKM